MCIDSAFEYLHLVFWNITKNPSWKIEHEDTMIVFHQADRPKPVQATKTVLDIYTFQSADQLARLRIHTPILAQEQVAGKIFQPETTGIQKLEINPLANMDPGAFKERDEAIGDGGIVIGKKKGGAVVHGGDYSREECGMDFFQHSVCKAGCQSWIKKEI